jgi:hypothetical protein
MDGVTIRKVLTSERMAGRAPRRRLNCMARRMLLFRGLRPGGDIYRIQMQRLLSRVYLAVGRLRVLSKDEMGIHIDHRTIAQ